MVDAPKVEGVAVPGDDKVVAQQQQPLTGDERAELLRLRELLATTADKQPDLLERIRKDR